MTRLASVLLLLFGPSFSDAHGMLTKPVSRSGYLVGVRDGLRTAGACVGVDCAWYTRVTTIPGNVTNCDPRMRTMGVSCGSTNPPDFPCIKRAPWCAPGTAHVETPCGYYGGGFEQEGRDMRDLAPMPVALRDMWTAGGTAEVGFSITANHGELKGGILHAPVLCFPDSSWCWCPGGGYSYRLW